MLYSNNPIIISKVGLLNHAEELNNVSRACKVLASSVMLFNTIKCSSLIVPNIIRRDNNRQLVWGYYEWKR